MLKNKIIVKKIRNIVILLMAIIVMIGAYKNIDKSRAEDVIEVGVLAQDNYGYLEAEEFMLEATQIENDLYEIELPESINTKKVNEILKVTLIDSEGNETVVYGDETVADTEEEKTEQDGTVTDSETTNSEIQPEQQEEIPSNKIQLTKEQIDTQTINVEVVYDVAILETDEQGQSNKVSLLEKTEEERAQIEITEETTTLYSKILKYEDQENGKLVEVKGYLPKDARLQIEEVSQEQLKEIFGERPIQVAYDIKIVVDVQTIVPTDEADPDAEPEYIIETIEINPEEFGETCEVSIKDASILENSQVLHVKEDNTYEEVNVKESVQESISFEAQTFSVYAVSGDYEDGEDDGTGDGNTGDGNTGNEGETLGASVSFSPSSGASWKQSRSVTVTSNDDAYGIQRYRLYNELTGSWTIWTSVTLSTSVTISIKTTGKWQIQVETTAMDGSEVGGVNPISTGVYWVDRTSPTAPTLTRTPESTNWTNQDVTVTLSGSTDAHSGFDKYFYSPNADGTGSQTYFPDGTPSSYTFTEEQNRTLYFLSQDNAGRWGGSPSTTIKIDKTMPSGTMEVSAECTNQPTITVYAYPTDEGGSGVKSVWMSAWYGTSWVSGGSNGGKTMTYDSTNDRYYATFTFADIPNVSTGATNQGDGNYRFQMHVNDNAGNSTAVTYKDVIYDTTPPTAGTVNMGFSSGANDYPNNTWTNKSVYLTPVNGTDSLSGHKTTTLTIKKDGASYLTDVGATTLTENGTYTITVKTTDNAGNSATNSTTYTVKIDKTAPTTPTLTNSSGGTGNWTNQAVTITANSTDALSGLAKIEYSYNQTSWYTSWREGELGDGDATDGQVSGVWMAESNLSVYVRATDNAGNVSAVAGPSYVKIDKTKPTAGTMTFKNADGTTYTPGVNNWTNQTVNLTLLNGADTGSIQSGHASTTYTINGTASTQTTLTTEGKYTIVITTKDVAGNVSDTRTYYVNIDKTNPTPATLKMEFNSYGSGNNYTNNTWTNKDVYVTLNNDADDALSGVASTTLTIKKDGAAYASNVTQTTLTETGTYTLTITTRDNAGNQATRTYTIKIDKIAPAKPTINNSSGGNWTNQPVTVTASSSDNGGSGLYRILYSYTGNSWYNNWVDPGTGTGDDNATDGQVHGIWSDERDTTLWAKAIDNAGNESAISEVTYLRIDLTKPIWKKVKNSVEVSGQTATVKIQGTDDRLSMFKNSTLTSSQIKILVNGSEITSGVTKGLSEATAVKNASGTQIGVEYTVTVTGFPAEDINQMKIQLPAGTLHDNAGNTNIDTDIIVYNALKKTNTETEATSGFLGNTSIARQDIHQVIFVDSIAGSTATGVQAWDVSAQGDNSIKAWTSQTAAPYTVYIGSDHEMFANYDSSYLFAWIGNSNSCTVTENVITSLNLLDTASTVNMQHMFYSFGGKRMTKLDLGSNFDTSNVTNMEAMFASCGYHAMTELDFGDKFNTSKVTDMSQMFLGCGQEAMTSLNLGSNFYTHNVTDMSGMFWDCGWNLTSLNLGANFNTSKVTDMENMFASLGWYLMTSLDLGDQFYTANVTNMDGMFEECGIESMTTLDLGPAFTKIADSHENFVYSTGKSGACTIYAPEAIYYSTEAFKLGGASTTTIAYDRGTINLKYYPEWTVQSTTINESSKTVTIVLTGKTNSNYSTNVTTALTKNDITVFVDEEVASSITKNVVTNTSTTAGTVKHTITLSNFEQNDFQSGKSFKEWSGNLALRIAGRGEASSTYTENVLKDIYGNQSMSQREDDGVWVNIDFKDAETIDKNTAGKMFADFIVPSIRYQHSVVDIDRANKTYTMTFTITDKYYDSANSRQLTVDDLTILMQNGQIDSDGNLIIYDMKNEPVTINLNVTEATHYGQFIGHTYTLTISNLEQWEKKAGLTTYDYSGIVSVGIPAGIAVDKSGNTHSAKTITSGINVPGGTDDDKVVVDVVRPRWETLGVSVDLDAQKATVTVRGTDTYFASSTLTSEKIKLLVNGVETSEGTISLSAGEALTETRIVDGSTTTVQYGIKYTITVEGFPTNVNQVKLVIPSGTLRDQSGNVNYTKEIMVFNSLKWTGLETGFASGFLGNTSIKREDIENVTFKTSTSGVNETKWDVSAQGDDSILAWYETTDSGALKVYIGSATAIFANVDSSYLFSYIGYGEKCTATETITNLNVLNTGVVKNMHAMFWFHGYRAMTSLDVSSLKTNKVTNMREMFNSCGYNAMTTFTLGSNFNTANVTDMSWMFANLGYTAMTQFALPTNFNTSNVTDMSYMFMGTGYTAMTDFSLGTKFYTSKVTDMSNMFNQTGVTAMTELDLGEYFDTLLVKDMGYMFKECGKLAMTTLKLGEKFNTYNVTNMAGMFWACGWAQLTELDLGDKFNTYAVTNMNAMFAGTGSKMQSLDLGDLFSTGSATDMDNMFLECGFNTMTSLDLGPAFTRIADIHSNFTKNMGKEGECIIYAPESIYSNRTAFKLGPVTSTSIDYDRGTINVKYKPEWTKESATLDTTNKTITVELKGSANSNYTSEVIADLNIEDITVYIDGEEAKGITVNLQAVSTVGTEVKYTLTIKDLEQALRQAGKMYKEWSGNISLKIAGRGKAARTYTTKTLVDVYGNQSMMQTDESGSWINIMFKDETKSSANADGKLFADFIKPEITYKYVEGDIDQTAKTVKVVFSVTDKYFSSSSLTADDLTVLVDGELPGDLDGNGVIDGEEELVITKTLTKKTSTEDTTDEDGITYKANGDIYYTVNGTSKKIGETYELLIEGLEQSEVTNGKYLDYSGIITVGIPANKISDASGNKNSAKTITMGVDFPTDEIPEEETLVTTLPSTKYTTPYLPEGYKYLSETDLDTGLVIKDAQGNEFVWVEVPKSTDVYKTAGLNVETFTTAEFAAIEADLNSYTSVYDGGASYLDQYYSDDLAGLTEVQYNTQKKKMLKSIYKNGGFYVGRYETGVENSYRTEAGDTTQTPVIKQNAYPYNYVSGAQAQKLSESFATGGYTSSLMFGVQWDLIMKYLEVKGTTQDELKSSGISWGNYKNSTYEITNTNAKYNELTTTTYELTEWKNGTYNRTSTEQQPVMLSTGASNSFSKQNISDLGGNVYEITLEYYTGNLYPGMPSPMSYRGGDCYWNYNNANYRYTQPMNSGQTLAGFRVALYKDEGTGSDIAATEPTYIPEGYTHVAGTDMNTGYVVKDSKGNEYVWVEVPKTAEIYKTAGLNVKTFTQAEYDAIEADLQTYTSAVVNREGIPFIEDTTLTEATETEINEYNNEKKRMLKSVYKNGGFYIGRYETGIADSSRTEAGPTTETPVIQKNAYPYARVTFDQALELAKGFASTGYTSSVIFGAQWDLTLKYLETKGTSQEELKTNSSLWGNYKNNEYRIAETNASYNIRVGDIYNGWQSAPLLHNSDDTILLTTGASTTFSKQNIYDLAGNVWEYTYEYYDGTNTIDMFRGSSFANDGITNTVGSLAVFDKNHSWGDTGFRVSLYKDEGTGSDEGAVLPYIPQGYTPVEGTNLDTGYVVKDASGNEFVWVEVPQLPGVYPTAGLNITEFTDTEYAAIEADLQTYTATYRNGTTFEDTNYTGTGLTDAQYSVQKKKMLKSIYKNGGFYIGRYETGIDYSQTYRTEGGNATQTPVIKQNAYPYNFVSPSQAQTLSSSFATTGYTSSLMFGMQWDLIMKYLETMGISQADLGTDSTAWGNYSNSTYNVVNTDAKYWESGATSWQVAPYEHTSGNTALTTGALETFKKQNIYDLAGNLSTWTLEHDPDTSNKVTLRGGSFWWYGSTVEGGVANSRLSYSVNDVSRGVGFRVALYKDEGTTQTSTVQQPTYIPEGYTHVEGTTMDNGYVIKDSAGNEFVWVEVPRIASVYKTAGTDITDFTATDFTAIENDLKTYTSTYRNGTTYLDKFSTNEALGLTNTQYNLQKKKMLSSIYKNEGFYVGRYETGIEGSYRYAAGDATQTPVIKPNVYVYNCVTASQAQTLSSGFATEGYTSSLMFGVQWDLILKYLETKGATIDELNTNSTTWGNYKSNLYHITNTNSKYSTNNGYTYSSAPYQKTEAATILLTTGASNAFSKQNISDLAGNVREWTLEYSNYSLTPNVARGSSYYYNNAPSIRSSYAMDDVLNGHGFRVALYKDEVAGTEPVVADVVDPTWRVENVTIDTATQKVTLDLLATDKYFDKNEIAVEQIKVYANNNDGTKTELTYVDKVLSEGTPLTEVRTEDGIEQEVQYGVKYTLTLTEFEEIIRQDGKLYKEWSGITSIQLPAETIIDKYGNTNKQQQLRIGNIDVIKPEFTYVYSEGDIDYNAKTVKVVFSVTDKNYKQGQTDLAVEDLTILVDGETPTWATAAEAEAADNTKPVRKFTSITDVKETRLINGVEQNVVVGRTYTLLLSNLEQDPNDGFTYSGIVTVAIPAGKVSDEKGNTNNAKTITMGIEIPEDLPSTEYTNPYLPLGYTHVEGNLTTGLVIQDALGNQFVWVEVPKSTDVYGTDAINLDLDNLTGEDLTNAYNTIETKLQAYTATYRNETAYSDTYHDGTGLTEEQYNTQKQKMLKSIYKNGGFYVGRYETGIIEGSRTSKTEELQTPVIKQNVYPYSYVTNSQAQSLASGFASTGYTSSLMYGVQWDLVLKYLETKGATQAELITDSTTWGNYTNNLYSITNASAKYSTDDGVTFSQAPYNKTSSAQVLLTTGASSSFSKQNISDLAGNVREWTLEYTNIEESPAVLRGSRYNQEGTMSVKTRANGTSAGPYGGFRVALYRDEDIEREENEGIIADVVDPVWIVKNKTTTTTGGVTTATMDLIATDKYFESSTLTLDQIEVLVGGVNKTAELKAQNRVELSEATGYVKVELDENGEYVISEAASEEEANGQKYTFNITGFEETLAEFLAEIAKYENDPTTGRLYREFSGEVNIKIPGGTIIDESDNESQDLEVPLGVIDTLKPEIIYRYNETEDIDYEHKVVKVVFAVTDKYYADTNVELTAEDLDITVGGVTPTWATAAEAATEGNKKPVRTLTSTDLTATIDGVPDTVIGKEYTLTLTNLEQDPNLGFDYSGVVTIGIDADAVKDDIGNGNVAEAITIGIDKPENSGSSVIVDVVDPVWIIQNKSTSTDANGITTATMDLIAVDKYFKTSTLTKEQIEVLVGGINMASDLDITLSTPQYVRLDANGEYVTTENASEAVGQKYTFTLTNFEETVAEFATAIAKYEAGQEGGRLYREFSGKVDIKVPAGTIEDDSGNKSKELPIDLGVIDTLKPEIIYRYHTADIDKTLKSVKVVFAVTDKYYKDGQDDLTKEDLEIIIGDDLLGDLDGNGLVDADEIFNEDTNGNGVLDEGEDTNGNGILDKSVTITLTATQTLTATVDGVPDSVIGKEYTLLLENLDQNQGDLFSGDVVIGIANGQIADDSNNTNVGKSITIGIDLPEEDGSSVVVDVVSPIWIAGTPVISTDATGTTKATVELTAYDKFFKEVKYNKSTLQGMIQILVDGENKASELDVSLSDPVYVKVQRDASGNYVTTEVANASLANGMKYVYEFTGFEESDEEFFAQREAYDDGDAATTGRLYREFSGPVKIVVPANTIEDTSGNLSAALPINLGTIDTLKPEVIKVSGTVNPGDKSHTIVFDVVDKYLATSAINGDAINADGTYDLTKVDLSKVHVLVDEVEATGITKEITSIQKLTATVGEDTDHLVGYRYTLKLSSFEQGSRQDGKSFLEWSGNVAIKVDANTATDLNGTKNVETTLASDFVDFIKPEIVQVSSTNNADKTQTIVFTATDKHFDTTNLLQATEITVKVNGEIADSVAKPTTAEEIEANKNKIFKDLTSTPITYDGETVGYTYTLVLSNFEQTETQAGKSFYEWSGNITIDIPEGAVIDKGPKGDANGDVTKANKSPATTINGKFADFIAPKVERISAINNANKTQTIVFTATDKYLYTANALQDSEIIVKVNGEIASTIHKDLTSSPITYDVDRDGTVESDEIVGYTYTLTLSSFEETEKRAGKPFYEWSGDISIDIVEGALIDNGPDGNANGDATKANKNALTPIVGTFADFIAPKVELVSATNNANKTQTIIFTATDKYFDTTNALEPGEITVKVNGEVASSIHKDLTSVPKVPITYDLDKDGTAESDEIVGYTYTLILSNFEQTEKQDGKPFYEWSGDVSIDIAEGAVTDKAPTLNPNAETTINGKFADFIAPKVDKVSSTPNESGNTHTVVFTTIDKYLDTTDALEDSEIVVKIDNEVPTGITKTVTKTAITYDLDKDGTAESGEIVGYTYTVVIGNIKQARTSAVYGEYTDYSGTITVDIAANAIKDTSGNTNSESVAQKIDETFADFIKPDVTYKYSESAQADPGDINYEGKTFTMVFEITDKYFTNSTLGIGDLTILIDGEAPDWREAGETVGVTKNLTITDIEDTFNKTVSGNIVNDEYVIGKRYTLVLSNLEQLQIQSGDQYLDYSGVISVEIPAGKATDSTGHSNAGTTITSGIDIPGGAVGDSEIVDVVDPLWQKVEASASAIDPANTTSSTATIKIKGTDKYYASTVANLADKITVWAQTGTTGAAATDVTGSVSVNIGTASPIYKVGTADQKVGEEYTITITGFTQTVNQIKIRIAEDAMMDTSGNGNKATELIVYNTLRLTDTETSNTSAFLGQSTGTTLYPTGTTIAPISRQDIQKVVFVNSLASVIDGEIPRIWDSTEKTWTFKSGIHRVWDVSAAQDDSIIAWTSQTSAPYTVYIGSNDEIFANQNSSYLFAHIGYGTSCTATEAVEGLSLLNENSVTNMAYMFNNFGNRNMTTLSLGTFDTRNVTNMEGMFNGCGQTLLETFSLGAAFNTAKVTDMSEMFQNFGAGKLQTLSLGDHFYTNEVTDMSNMFNGCGQTLLSTFSLGSHFNTAKVTDMSGMFQNFGAGKLQALSLGSSFYTNEVTDMSNMFNGCGATLMTTLNLGANFNTAKVQYMNGMFQNCGTAKLTSLDLGNQFYTTLVTNMNNMFNGCGTTSMTVLDLGPLFTKISTQHTDFMKDCGNSSLVVYAPESIYADKNAFK